MCYPVLKRVLILTMVGMASARAQTTYNLQQALQTAKSNNPILKREQFNVGISQADITTAQLRPNVILNNQSLQLVQPSKFPENTGWANGANRQICWQVTKPFQLPVQRENKINFAQQNVRLTEKQYADTERHLFQSVAQKWLDVWAARKQLDAVCPIPRSVGDNARAHWLSQSIGKCPFRPLAYPHWRRPKQSKGVPLDLIRSG